MTASPSSFLVFGVTGPTDVAAAIAALGLQLVVDGQEIATANAASTTPTFVWEDAAEDEDDEDSDDGDDDEDDTDDDDDGGDDWDEGSWDVEDLTPRTHDTPGIRRAQPSTFAQMVGGAVAGRQVEEERRAARRPRPLTLPTPPQTPIASAPTAPIAATPTNVDIAALLAQGATLAPAGSMLHARLQAAGQGCAMMANATQPATPITLTLDTSGAEPALFVGVGEGAPWPSAGVSESTLNDEQQGRIAGYLRAVFPEWLGARLFDHAVG